MKKLGLLAAATVLFWAALIYPAWVLWGDNVWIQSTTAMTLCLLPALVVLAWVLQVAAPESQLVAVLGGTGIRMFVTLAGALVIHKAFPEVFTDAFWGWLAVFYFFLLAVETAMVLKDTERIKPER